MIGINITEDAEDAADCVFAYLLNAGLPDTSTALKYQYRGALGDYERSHANDDIDGEFQDACVDSRNGTGRWSPEDF